MRVFIDTNDIMCAPILKTMGAFNIIWANVEARERGRFHHGQLHKPDQIPASRCRCRGGGRGNEIN